ncbi:hypothetical protein KCP91_08825 [Microvirga sp. SRT01]|uniref:RCK C-terminal domain-containing protein n=1 Tax=Sphingomonas longa TaxID=2778730 RepID=A0ABS2D6C9_9SPHN|nr:MULTISPECIES: hypothetical protein [Alphaproteobacteria]MBM6576476.1 hypothetical protein [Sphingomonas sp. BT552]MBR7709522.1 hypothetical protein [Microvirga sp. SRT01]
MTVLHVAGIKSGEGGTAAIDDHVRFAFESPFGTGGTGTIVVVDEPGGMAEIGIDCATGRLRGATLVTFARQVLDVPDDLVMSLPVDEGLPVLSADMFAGDADGLLPRIVVPGPIDLLRGAKFGIVRIGTAQPDRVIRSGDAVFLIAGDALWGFGADRLSADARARMTG